MNATLSDLQSRTTTSVAEPPKRWKTRVLLPGLIVAAVLALLLFTSIETIMPATPVRVVPVVVKTVEGAAGTVTVQAPGWLEPDPHPYYVAALADGIVDDVLVLAGEPVEAGQVVAQLVDDDARLALRRAGAVLGQRQSSLTAARAELTAAKLQLEHLVERKRAVAAAEAQVAEAESEIQKVHADIAVDRARLGELQDEYDRKSQLIESKAVSEGAVARLELRVEAQQATLDATVASETVLEAKLRAANAELTAAVTNRDLLIEEQRAVALAEAGVANAEAAVALAQAARDEAALRLDRMQVRSPVDGIVMRRLVSPGSKLTLEGAEQSAHVVHVYDPEHLQVRVDVPLADVAKVMIGQDVEVTVEVLPDHTFTGHVTRVVHQADIQKNTVEVKVAIDDPSSELKPDMLARAKFLATGGRPDGSVRQRVFAPDGLLRRDGDGRVHVLVVGALVDGRGRVEQRTLTPGSRAIDGWVEIDDGLKVGDLLVADPPSGLEPGDRVRVIGEAGKGGA